MMPKTSDVQMAALDFLATPITGNLKNDTTNSNKFLSMRIGGAAHQ
jgi:hypothetical protein